MMDFDVEKNDLQNPQAILDFRDIYLDLLQKVTELHFVDFFPYFLEKI